MSTMAAAGLPNLDEFFDHLAPWIAGYNSKVFSYFGHVVGGEDLSIRLGRLRLSVGEETSPRTVRIGNHIAGQIAIRHFGRTPQEFLRALLQEGAVDPRCNLRLKFLSTSDAGVAVQEPEYFHAEGLSTGHRLSVLTILGGETSLHSERALDWQLRAAPVPYDGLRELLTELGLGTALGHRSMIEVVAHPVVQISGESKLEAETATIELTLPKGLKRSNTRVNYRALSKGQLVARGSLSGTKVQWRRTSTGATGTATITVASSSVIQCYAVYAEQVHHIYWLVDPTRYQNPRLAAFDVADPGLGVLRSFLSPALSAKGQVAQQFEVAISWMLWAYGLAPAQVSAADQSKNGPDIIAMAPNGGVVIVECTLAILKADSKLVKVRRRALEVREKMLSAGLPNTSVLPIIVTALPRQQVSTELDDATDAGVLVLTKEDLEAAANGILAFPDGNRVFQGALDALASAEADLKRRRNTIDGGTF